MKSNIRQRVFRLVLSSSLITFFVLSLVLIVGMLAIRSELNEKSDLLRECSVEYIQEAMKNRGKSELETLAKAKAQHLNQEMVGIEFDAQYFAEGMNVVLTSTPEYKNLKVANYETIYAGEPYIFYAPEILQRGIDANLADEIARASDIADLLTPIGRLYKGYTTSFLAASKNGYFICAETNTGTDGNTIDFSEDFLTGYDARTRPWYQKGEKATKPIFSDIYNDTGGIPTIACVAPYYYGNGDFAGVISIAYRTENIYKIVVETAVGVDGFSFILDSSGNVIISAKNEGIFATKEEDYDLREKAAPDLAEATKKMAAGETGVASILIDDSKYYLAYAPMPETNWSFGTLMNHDTLLAPALSARANLSKQMNDFRNSIEQLFFSMFIISVVLLVLLSVWMFLGSSRVSKNFVKPIQELSNGVQEISGGNFDKKLEIKTGDEIEQLANSFNTMTDNLKTYMANLEEVTAAEERIATELKVATNIQLSALPHDFPGHEAFEIYATMHAAKEVGGDFYDFYMLDENHLMMTIADVSGKGVPAALFMMQGKTILKNLAMTMQSPDDLAAVMALANQQLCQGNDEMMFITVFIAMLDLKTGKLIYVNGGHNPPMLYRDAENKFHYMDVEQNCVLGLMDEMDFEQQETQMNHGDIIYLYTDGVTEAMNKNREQYGEDRLENCLNTTEHKCNLQMLLDSVKESLAQHVQDAEQSDDITMLSVRFK